MSQHDPVSPDLVAKVKAALPEAIKAHEAHAQASGHKTSAINWAKMAANIEAALPDVLSTLSGLGVLTGTPLSIATAIISMVGILGQHNVIPAPAAPTA